MRRPLERVTRIVGACIHTPPPNRIVHVTANSGFETGGDLYTPVWVEGLMNSERSTFNFGLVDGSSEIPSAYAIDALSVTLYD